MMNSDGDEMRPIHETMSDYAAVGAPVSNFVFQICLK